jgi:hypothetical protein
MQEHNIMSLEGITDQEYVDNFGVPSELANSAAINDWMINDTYERNITAEYEAAIKEGRNENEAKQWANKVANQGRSEARKLLKKVRKARGY